MALAIASCADTDLQEPLNPADPDITVTDDAVIVTASLDLPEMAEAETRAMGDEAALANLHLYLVEFVDNGNTLLNTLSTVYEAQQERVDGDQVLFKLTLNKTDRPRILHLIALPKSETLTVPFGIEGSVIPALKTSDNTEAYWRRLSFPNGYCTEVSGGQFQPDPELKQKLTRVPLVRNFACVSVTNRAAGFVLEGFEVINNPQQGTIAPWNPNAMEFPEFLDDYGQPKTYQSLSANYSGLSPAKTPLGNQIAGAGPAVNSTAPKYIYERPFTSIYHTYLIIKGRRGGKSYFYKLDIGKNDSMGIFRYYALLRNFKYNIVLNSVGADGYDTIEEAAQGTVYNNFSFDIELNSMLNMSDGKEIVFVNFTTAVLTSPTEQTLEFKYRYRNATGNGPTYNNGGVNFVGLEPGPVIKSVKYGTTDDSQGWRTVTLTINPAAAETQIQQFILVKPTGLGRTINLILHQKWNYINLKEFPGEYINWDASTPGEGTASPGKGQYLGIFS